MLTFAFLCIAVISYASVTIPNTFSPGTTISSSQVNANFTAMANAINGATVHGIINPNGTIFSGSGNFTASRMGTGYYEVVFTPGAFTKQPACVTASDAGAPTLTCSNSGGAPDALDIRCYTVSVTITALNTPAQLTLVPTN